MTTWKPRPRITTLTGRPSSLAISCKRRYQIDCGQLYDIVTSCKSKGAVEPWFADLVVKILLSVNRVCGDLLKTIDQDSLSSAAWNSRNLLELWVWLKYCATSRENARRFHEDAIRDMQGLTDALSKLHAL